MMLSIYTRQNMSVGTAVKYGCKSRYFCLSLSLDRTKTKNASLPWYCLRYIDCLPRLLTASKCRMPPFFGGMLTGAFRPNCKPKTWRLMRGKNDYIYNDKLQAPLGNPQIICRWGNMLAPVSQQIDNRHDSQRSSLIPPSSRQDIYNRQKTDPGYCLAKRVNQVYYDTSRDLGAHGEGNQCKAGKCMIEALKAFAGKDDDGIPPEVVRAMLLH